MSARVEIFTGVTSFVTTLGDDGRETFTAWSTAVATGEHVVIPFVDRATSETTYIATSRIDKIVVRPS